ncbi:G/T mismatch-specific thymine DNA glycosylase [Trichinella nelsoni]|uniref:G/T mismatch-specific thymine DNA glycosylase n=1 Tax=Trichinella nelsoni TaxID=6336 RepID=A0A0V0RMN7_9BILA|nr:G/T mismatch-specific thymine DNA glycosylase [Trichinella nelsoni]
MMIYVEADSATHQDKDCSTALAAIGTQHCPSVLPDHIAHGLDILIVSVASFIAFIALGCQLTSIKLHFQVGINPGLISATHQHYYANHSNHFWKCLFLSRLIPKRLQAKIREGAAVLRRKVLHYHPKIVAFNGKGIYSVFCGKSTVEYGLQKQRIDGSDALVYVMPSSSARCSQFPRLIDKVPFFVELKKLRDQLCCHNTSGGGIGSARHRLLFMESQSQISFDGLPEKANGGDFYVGMSDVEGNVDDNEQQVLLNNHQNHTLTDYDTLTSKDVAASASAVEQQLQQHAAEVWSDHHVGDIGSNLSLDLSACIESGMPPIMQVERKLVGEVATSDSQVAMSQVESLAETSSPKVPTPNSSSSLPQQIAVHVEEAIEAVVQRARDGPLEMPAFRTPPEKHHPPANAHQHNMLANLAMQQGINFGLDELGLSAKPDQLFACYNDQVPFGAYYQQAAVAAAGGRGSYQHHPSPNDTGASFLNSNQACYGSVLPQWTFGAVPATSSSNPDLYSQQAAQACRLMQGQSTYFQNAASGSFSNPTGSIIGQQMYNTALPTVSAELSSAYFNQQTQQLQSSLYSDSFYVLEDCLGENSKIIVGYLSRNKIDERTMLNHHMLILPPYRKAGIMQSFLTELDRDWSGPIVSNANPYGARLIASLDPDRALWRGPQFIGYFGSLLPDRIHFSNNNNSVLQLTNCDLLEVTKENLNQVLHYDSGKIHPTCRDAFLTSWMIPERESAAAALALCAMRHGTVVGYGVMRKISDTYYDMAPVYADDDAVAMGLMKQLCAWLVQIAGSGVRIYYAFPIDQKPSVRLAEELGLKIEDHETRIYQRELVENLPWKHCYAIHQFWLI